MLEAIFHDTGEMGPGDMTTTAKSDPVLKRRMDEMEIDTRLRMVLPWSLPPRRWMFTPYEEWLLKMADWLAGWETAMQECWMGNRFLEAALSRYRERIDAALYTTHPDILLDASETIRRVIDYMRRREAAWSLQCRRD